MSQLAKEAMSQAIQKLLGERPLDKITIRDITDECGLTRNTFYYHFRDIYDLCSWTFIREAEEIINKYQGLRNWEEGFVSGLRLLQSKKKMIYHVYKSINREDLEAYLYNIVGSYLNDFIEVGSEGIVVSPEARRIAIEFYKNAFVGSILQWINNDMKEAPEDLAYKYNAMFLGTLKPTLKVADEMLSEQN